MGIAAENILKNIGNFMIDFTPTHVQTDRKPINKNYRAGKPRNGGVPIVLTASRIEMNDFNLSPFFAFSGSFPPILPRHLLNKVLYGPSRFNMDGTAKFAPYGLRKVEALLIKEFGEENVATVHPQSLGEFIGPETKVVGISTMDPLGIGFVSRTYSSILGLSGKSLNHIAFESLLSNPALRKYNPKIIVGGSGAWQISNAKMQDKLNIDTILIGKAETTVTEIFRKALASERIDRIITTISCHCSGS